MTSSADRVDHVSFDTIATKAKFDERAVAEVVVEAGDLLNGV